MKTKTRFQNSFLKSLLFFCGLLFCINVLAATPADMSLAPMLKKVLPSVVNVRTQVKITDLSTLSRVQQEQGQINPNNIPEQFISMGSGVIVDADKGLIVTNAHVVEDAQLINITLGDGRHFIAKLIGMDKSSDIALLQIHAKKLTAIQMSDSNALKVGDFVAAIGNPFGLNQSVTSGIVSALGRTTLGIESLENFIQTDAPINPGNSGGALVNLEGQLVGINTAILSPDRTGNAGSVGIGFAIPINMVKSVIQQLIQFGNVRRGALGVGAEDITPELAAAFNLSQDKGAVITQVILNSPAQKAGLKVGDVIISVNGADIKNANDVVNAIAFLRVDSKANIEVLRNNQKTSMTATITDPEKRHQADVNQDPFLYGVTLKDFTLFSPIHGDIKGVLVVNVDQDTNAWQADLHPGDVITTANQKPVTTVADLQKITASAKDTLLLHILRGPGAIFLVVNKEQ